MRKMSDKHSRYDFDARRKNAEGKNREGNHFVGRNSQVTSVFEQVLDEVGQKTVCQQILAEIEGVYHVFGAAFSVEKHTTQEFMVLKYLGALKDNLLHQAGVRENYFVPLSKLLVFGKQEDRDMREDSRTLLSFLCSQPPMQEAVEERKDMLRKRYTERRDSARAEIEATFQKASEGRVPRNAPPTLQHLGQLLTETWGTLEHEEVSYLVCFGQPRQDSRDVVVRIKNAPEGHPLEEMVKENIFVLQSHLPLSELDHEVHGKGVLARNMRQYLRNLLRSVGALPEQKIQA